MTCRQCGAPLHVDEPYVQSSIADIQLHIDCYLKRSAFRRPAAFIARIRDLLGVQVVMH